MTQYITQNHPGGALPLTFPFDLPISGDVTIAFSGSCWSAFAKANCGFAVYLDDKHIGDVPLYFNNANQHQTLSTYFFPVNIDFGQHAIKLLGITDTTRCDQNDTISLWIVD